MSKSTQKAMAYQAERPFVSKLDISDAPLRSVVNLIAAKKDMMGQQSPDNEAARFYMLNHARQVVGMRVKAYEPLGKYEEVMDLYFDGATDVFTRLFYYMMLICTRETRHCKNPSIVKKLNPTAHAFLKHIQGTGSSSAVSRFLSDPPDVTLGEYTEFMFQTFDKGNYNGGYGGKAWAEVAEPLRDFVHGTISAEALVDTGFTLAHNNGPIFNKGMLYDSYTSELVALLDVQRAGMIPQLFHDLKEGRKYLNTGFTDAVKELHTKLAGILGGPFTESMDWEMVHKLGSMSNVSQYLHKQKQFFGTKAPAVKADDAEYLFVTPMQKVKKLSRKQLVLG